MDNVATIAGKLTKAQRAAIRNASYGASGFGRTHLYHAGSGPTGKAMYLRKLVTFGGALTPLGLAVRTHLKGETNG